MVKKMDYGLGGMRMDRRVMKELTRMENEMDYGLGGMKMDRRGMKELTRMGN